MRGFLALIVELLVRVALLLLVVALAPPVRAELAQVNAGVYKCTGERGVPVYQGTPCAPGRELRDFAAEPANLSVVEMHVPAPTPPPAVARHQRATRAPPRTGKAQLPGDPAERRLVKAGMSEGVVLAKLGAPDAASAKHGRHARWTYLPAPGDPQTVTTIRFEDGRVTSVERHVVR
jgi:hypothetical protein